MKWPTKDVIDALNRHGVYLKKATALIIKKRTTSLTNGFGLIQEDLAVTFGVPGSLDIIAREITDDFDRTYFSIECKRTYSEAKAWVFFPSEDGYARLHRSINRVHWNGHYAHRPTGVPVCSEGAAVIDLDKLGKKRANDPPLSASVDEIYENANQLARNSLGFFDQRLRDHNSQTRGLNMSSTYERHVPVMVTNAEIFVCEYDATDICVNTGSLGGPAKFVPYRWIILRHPLAMPGSHPEEDFRFKSVDSSDGERVTMRTHECLFVVKASHLNDFFDNKPWLKTE